MIDLGRLRILNSSKDGFDIVQHRELQALELYTPPVPRNFSYPTNVSLRPRAPTHASCPIYRNNEGQLGESHTSSPGRISGGKAADIRGLYVVKPNQHKTSVRLEPKGQPAPRARPSKDKTPLGIGNQPRKKQRRGTLAGLSVSPLPSVTLFKASRPSAPSTDTTICKNRLQALGDRTNHHHSLNHPHKGSSQGQHKVAQSLDAPQYLSFHSAVPDRPASSSGDPLVDSRLRYSASPDPIQSTSPVDYQISNMSVGRYLRVSPTSFGKPSVEHHRQQDEGSSIEPNVRKMKSTKERLLSQIKDWVSTSEPSSQALKNYKKDAYKRAGIAPDDPRAPVKLHIPVATLPPEAIKPSGPGLDPEEIVFKKAEMKRMRHSFRTIGGMGPGSRSSASQRSSFSSLHLSD